MRNSALVVIAFLAFPWPSFATGQGGAAFADSLERQTPPRLQDVSGDDSNSSERSAAIAQPTPPSLVVEHDAFERRTRLWSTFWGLLAIAGVAALAGKGVAMYRQRQRRRKLLLENLYSIDNGEGAANDAGAVKAERGVPRCLPINPYVDPASPKLLGLQIEKAIEASTEFGRVLGIVFFDLGEPPKDVDDETAAARVGEIAELVVKLQACLRATDHVALINDREIVVCIGLLPGRTELMGIANRLRQIGRKHSGLAAAFDADPGLAIYPVSGYRGDELIDYARADYAAHKSAAATARESEIRASERREASKVTAAE